MFMMFSEFCDHFDFITSNYNKDSFDVIVTSFVSVSHIAIGKHWDIPLIFVNPSLLSQSNPLLSFLISSSSSSTSPLIVIEKVEWTLLHRTFPH